MGSMYAALRKAATLGSANTARLADLDETDPYYFVVMENGKTLAEGDLTIVKLRLDERYFYRPIKRFNRDRVTMVATIEY
jgi:hypothetical protein